MVRKTYSRPFWLIVKYQPGGMEVLRTTLASGKEALPIFGFEDEARMFLALETSGCWRVRQTTTDELTSVLFGICPGVDRVVLDPPPGPFAKALMDLVSMGREAFIHRVVLEKRGGLTVGHRFWASSPARRRDREKGNA